MKMNKREKKENKRKENKRKENKKREKKKKEKKKESKRKEAVRHQLRESLLSLPFVDSSPRKLSWLHAGRPMKKDKRRRIEGVSTLSLLFFFFICDGGVTSIYPKRTILSPPPRPRLPLRTKRCWRQGCLSLVLLLFFSTLPWTFLLPRCAFFLCVLVFSSIREAEAVRKAAHAFTPSPPVRREEPRREARGGRPATQADAEKVREKISQAKLKTGTNFFTGTMSKHTALGLAGATAFGGACFLFYVFSKKPPPQSSFPSEQERKAIFDKNAVTWDGGIGLDEA
ncbi:putative transmembrane protein, partial [Toxoplasma gondii GAB2-2007-GAL-DOM2]